MNKTEIKQILASESGAGITLAFCAGLWSVVSLLQYSQALKLLGKDMSCLLWSGSLWTCKWTFSERSWGHLAVETILPVVEMVTELARRREVNSHSTRPGLLPAFIFVLFSFCFSFSYTFVIYTNEQMLLIFSSLSILLGHWSQAMECLWPSLGHQPTSNKSRQVQLWCKQLLIFFQASRGVWYFKRCSCILAL